MPNRHVPAVSRLPAAVSGKCKQSYLTMCTPALKLLLSNSVLVRSRDFSCAEIPRQVYPPSVVSVGLSCGFKVVLKPSKGLRRASLDFCCSWLSSSPASWGFSTSYSRPWPSFSSRRSARVMYAVMASCSSSLVFSRGHSLYFHASRAGRLYLRPQAVLFRNTLGLKWVTAKPYSRGAAVMASVSDPENSTEIIDISISSDDGGAPGVQPRRKRERSKNVKTSGKGGALEGSEEEEEWDFFGELASHIDKESQRGWTGLEEDHPETPTTIEAEVVDTATDNANAGVIVESSPEAASPSFGGRQGSKGESLRKEDTSDDEDDDVNFDDPKYQQKPDWMQDEVWEAIKNQGPGDENDEEQPLWVDEEDPTWPDEEPEDGWGFKTSQFFDKVSIKNDKPAKDDDEDDEELKMNWENEADDWMIQEITANDWESSVFADPSPLIVYAFARYGRRGKDSWKTLEQLEKAVTSVWESAKAPLRAVKVDIGMEIDLGSALDVDKDECPQLLFIKNGKGLYRLKDQRTSEELVQLMAHFFYNGAKPSFLNTTSSPESLRSVA